MSAPFRLDEPTGDPIADYPNEELVDDADEGVTPDELVEVLGEDDDLGAVVVTIDANGEVRNVDEAPDGSGDVRALADWVGENLAAATARKAGLEAERDARIAQIHARYDGKIKTEASLIRWLSTRYMDTFWAFARQALHGKTARSLDVGFLRLSFRRKPGRVEVADKTTALGYVALTCPNAIKITHSILVSELTPEARENIASLSPDTTGLVVVPPSNVFDVNLKPISAHAQKAR